MWWGEYRRSPKEFYSMIEINCSTSLIFVQAHNYHAHAEGWRGTKEYVQSRRPSQEKNHRPSLWFWAVNSELRSNNILASLQTRGPRKSQEVQVLASPVFCKVSSLNWERKIHSHMSPLQDW